MHSAPDQAAHAGFWDSRTGWRRLKQFLLLEPLPGGSRWAAAFGSLLLFSFVVQVVTGVLLATSYSPGVDSAWPSVQFIEKEAYLGSFIRAIHHWGSSAMVVLLLVHILQVFVWGAYKKPRELTWMFGVLLLVCTLGLAFTGYLLPWDQKAYWATRVGLGLISTVPGVGDGLRVLMQGGDQMGNLTLTRFFALHVFLLPGALILLVVVHVYLFRVHGVTPPPWQTAEQHKAAEEPFWPKQVLKDAVFALVFLVGLGLWAHYRPAPLEAQADPSLSYEARPEWYFMFFFQILRYFSGPYEVVGTFYLPLLFFLVLFFWPLLDRNPQRDPRRRPVALGLLGLATAGLVGLTYYAIATDVRMTEPVQAAVKPAAAKAETAGPLQRADVARIYNDNCASCHGVDGSARLIRAGLPTIPDFTSLTWQTSQTDLEIVHRIREGNEPLMPAYRDKLAQQEMLALAVYVRAFAIGPTEPTPAPRADVAGLAVGAFVVLRPAPPPPPTPPPSGAPVPTVQVYRTYCLACHDADGAGKTVRSLPGGLMKDIPDFTDPKWQDMRGDAECKKSILDGKGQFMLAMKDKLSADDAERMVVYLRAFRGGKHVVETTPKPIPIPPSPSVPTTVREVPKPPAAPPEDAANRLRVATGHYRQYCLICHDADGRGSKMRPSMPSIPDFTSRAWQDSVGNPQASASILDGKGTLMPAFAGRLRAEEVRDLVAYLRAFGPVQKKPPEAPQGDFEKRYQELQDQWNELQKQLKEVSKPPSGP